MEAAGDLPQIIRLVLALAFVLALMGGFALLVKKLGLTNNAIPRPGKRLKFVESLPLGPRHRAVLIQRDDKQHLVILGPNGETVVETDIAPKDENEAIPFKKQA